ncbi:TPA: hypothetical protein MHL26_15330 [Klebsiella quasipneumoniae]|nr:hypothetical protein [Klebsiella quasipneumoniae]
MTFYRRRAGKRRRHYLQQRNIKFTILFFLCGGGGGFFRHIAGGHTLIKINSGNLSFAAPGRQSFVLPITNLQNS